MSNQKDGLHEIFDLYLPKNFPNRGALERRIAAEYTHNDVVEQRCLEARINEWTDARPAFTDKDAANSIVWRLEDDRGDVVPIEDIEEFIDSRIAQLTNLQNKEEK